MNRFGSGETGDGPAMRLPRIILVVIRSRIQLLLFLWFVSAAGFYLLVLPLSAVSGVLSVPVSAAWWAFVMGATCHGVLWSDRPSLSECAAVSLKALGYTFGLVLVSLTAFFLGLALLVLPGLAALALLSLAVPLMLHERPAFITALMLSVRLAARYWGSALMLVVFGFVLIFVTTIIALLLAGFFVAQEVTNSNLYEALTFGVWAVLSALLGCVYLLAIRAVDDTGQVA